MSWAAASTSAAPVASSVTRAFPGHRQWVKIAAATPWPIRVRPSRIDRGCGLRLSQPKRAAPSVRHWRSARVEKRSEEHTSELQSRQYLVCRLLLEKKKE